MDITTIIEPGPLIQHQGQQHKLYKCMVMYGGASSNRTYLDEADFPNLQRYNQWLSGKASELMIEKKFRSQECQETTVECLNETLIAQLFNVLVSLTSE